MIKWREYTIKLKSIQNPVNKSLPRSHFITLTHIKLSLAVSVPIFLELERETPGDQLSPTQHHRFHHLQLHRHHHKQLPQYHQLTSTPLSPPSSSNMSTGALVAIIIGAVVVVLLSICSIWCWKRKKHRDLRRFYPQPQESPHRLIQGERFCFF